MNNQGRSILAWAALFVFVILLFNVFQSDGLLGGRNNITFSDF